MKKELFSLLLLLLSFSLTNAQFFEDYQQTEEAQSSGFFNNEPTPEYEVDGRENPSNPGGEAVPINNYLFLLPLLGMAVGSYYLLRRREELQ